MAKFTTQLLRSACTPNPLRLGIQQFPCLTSATWAPLEAGKWLRSSDRSGQCGPQGTNREASIVLRWGHPRGRPGLRTSGSGAALVLLLWRLEKVGADPHAVRLQGLLHQECGPGSLGSDETLHPYPNDYVFQWSPLNHLDKKLQIGRRKLRKKMSVNKPLQPVFSSKQILY